MSKNAAHATKAPIERSAPEITIKYLNMIKQFFFKSFSYPYSKVLPTLSMQIDP